MKYWKKEYPTIQSIAAVGFTDYNYIQVDLDPKETQVSNTTGDFNWCENHYTSEHGWTEIEKGEFLLIKSQSIEKL